ALLLAGCGGGGETSSSSKPTSSSTGTSQISTGDPYGNGNLVKENTSQRQIALPAGASLVDTYVATYTADMYTFDYLNTYHATDSEILVNLVDGLIEHDTYGILRPMIAEAVYANDDQSEFTFKIKKGIKWVTSDGTVYPQDVRAQDFVTGMQHLLDAQGGLEYIVTSANLVNAQAYMDGEVPFSQVGVKAVDDYTLVYSLSESTPYFLSTMEYNPYMPMNKDFFVSQGCGLGVDEWKDSATTCKYGVTGEPDSILYNGAYLMTNYTSSSIIQMSANPHYQHADDVKTKTITFLFEDGSNPDAMLTAFKNGQYSAVGVSNTILERARSEFVGKLYTVDTNATTFYGTWNLNRKKYETGSVKSVKTESQKADTRAAILNKNFRKAVNSAFDKASWNAVSVGNDLKLNSLRNSLTHPEFVSISEAYGGYAAGTMFGEIVASEIKKLDPSWSGSTDDQVNGWYDISAAKAFAAAAKAELQGKVTFPIHIDVVYYSASVTQDGQVKSFKQAIEAALGSDFIV
ncbi:MAG: hypothetical protein GX664_03440, partial [Bacteroidales bacterium]|nr:hypothetical protein [Bacteroidales bacterium]